MLRHDDKVTHFTETLFKVLDDYYESEDHFVLREAIFIATWLFCFQGKPCAFVPEQFPFSEEDQESGLELPHIGPPPYSRKTTLQWANGFFERGYVKAGAEIVLASIHPHRARWLLPLIQHRMGPRAQTSPEFGVMFSNVVRSLSVSGMTERFIRDVYDDLLRLYVRSNVAFNATRLASTKRYIEATKYFLSHALDTPDAKLMPTQNGSFDWLSEYAKECIALLRFL